MKKALSFVLTVSLLLGLFLIYPSAKGSRQGSVFSEDIGTINVCTYDPSSKTVKVSGNIDHDVLISHSKYYIALYSIPYGEDMQEYLESGEAVALAKTDISLKFDFSVKADTNEKRFSSYCVVISNDDGELKPVTAPKYPNVVSGFKYKSGDKSSYKGVSSSLTSLLAASNVSASIVPVYLDRLLSSTSVGFIYSLQGTYIYFDKNYIEELDVRVKTLSATGSAVYLQFVMGEERTSVSELLESGVPDMSSRQNVDLICAFTDFLCERYDDRYAGTIRGIILGSKIDKGFENSGCDNIDQYTENYARYAETVACVAREAISDIDITIPFSDTDSYSVNAVDAKSKPSELLEQICAAFDRDLASPLVFSTMIESDALPYNLSEQTLKDGELGLDASERIVADNASRYSEYLDSLRVKFDNAPHSYIFVFNAPCDISYNLLSCAYSYSYFKLMSDKNLSSFIVSFEKAEAAGDYSGLAALSPLIREIDTAESFNVTKPQLNLLGAETWYEIISDMYSGNYDLKKVLEFRTLSKLPSNILGSYSYYDFSYQTDLSSWFKGSHCDSLKIDYGEIGGRNLEAHFSNSFNSPSEYSEIYCAYEYHENFDFTPYMAVRFSIENDTQNDHTLYEVKVSFGSKNHTAETSTVCLPYEEVEMLLDFTAFNEATVAEYIVVSVRCLSGNESGYSLYLSSIDGYSDKYLSNELSSLIAEERLRIRNMLGTDSSSSESQTSVLFVVTGVVIVAAVTALGIFMCLRREELDEE